MNPDENIDFIIGDPENCKNTNTATVKVFWMPVVQGNMINGQYQWLDNRRGFNDTPMTGLKWKRSEPNGLHTEPCVTAWLLDGEYLWNDESCHPLKCSICDMPVIQTYWLRGPDLFDHKYLFSLDSQENSSKIRFEGVESSWIIWTPLKGHTQIMDMRYNYSTNFDHNPFGLTKPQKSISQKDCHQWVFTNVSSLESNLLYQQQLIYFFFCSAIQVTSLHVGMVIAYL